MKVIDSSTLIKYIAKEEKWEKVEEYLRPYLAYNGHGYKLYRCPFHPPDNHPSLLLNLKKGYLHDWHDNNSYSLKAFLKRVGALTSKEKIAYNSEKKEKYREPVKFSVAKFADVLKNAKGVKYIIPPLLPKGSLIILSGHPGCGKSFLTLDLLLKVAQGNKWLEQYEIEKQNVLLCDFENSLSLLKERVEFLVDSIPENFYIITDTIYLDDKNMWPYLEKTITENSISLVVFDNLSCMFKATRENNNLRIYYLLKKLRDLCLKHNVTTIIIHHTRKQQPFTSFNLLDEIRGSSTITALADMVYLLQKVQDFYKLQIIKNRINNIFESFLLELDRGFRLLQKDVQGLAGDKLNAVIRHIEVFASQKPQGVFTPKELKEAGQFTDKEVFSGIQFLSAVGKIKKLRRGVYQYQMQATLTSDDSLERVE